MAIEPSDLTTIMSSIMTAAEATFLALMAKSTLKLGTTSTSAPESQRLNGAEYKLV